MSSSAWLAHLILHHPVCLIALQYNSNALLSIHVLSIFSIWPKNCSHFTSNSIATVLYTLVFQCVGMVTRTSVFFFQFQTYHQDLKQYVSSTKRQNKNTWEWRGIHSEAQWPQIWHHQVSTVSPRWTELCVAIQRAVNHRKISWHKPLSCCFILDERIQTSWHTTRFCCWGSGGTDTDPHF